MTTAQKYKMTRNEIQNLQNRLKGPGKDKNFHNS